MKEAAKILLYTAAVLVAGCLLAPPLYWAGRALVTTIPALEGHGFSRYWNRAVLVCALALAFPFLRSLGIGRWQDLQLEPNPRRWRDLGVGVLVGVVGLWLVAAVKIAVGRAKLRGHPRWDDVATGFVTAVIVAIVEEAFFRGALFGVLRRQLSWPRALAFLSVVFAALHFLKLPKKHPEMTDVDWLAGFRLFPQMLYQFGKPELVVGGFVTLVLVGWVLGYAVVRTRSLYLSIGLHGGWVFALKSFEALAKKKGHSSAWFGKNLLTGFGPVLLLIVTLAVMTLLLARFDREKESPT